VSGTDTNGNAVSETLQYGQNGTFVTQNAYASIASIKVNQGSGANAMLEVQSVATGTQYDTAGSIAVDPNIQKDVTLIATSNVPGAPGNAENALALLSVQDAQTIGAGQTASTIGDFYSGNTASLGAAASQAHTQAQSQQQLVQSLQNQKQSLVGVSTDQEAATLVALQHAYEAAARAITTQDSMLNTIINGMGLVGTAAAGG